MTTTHTSCKTRVLAGLGREPVAVQHEPEYAHRRTRFAPGLFVDDCPGGCILFPEPWPLGESREPPPDAP